MADQFVVQRIQLKDERKLRRWLMARDPQVALDLNLGNYFLTSTDAFGVQAAISDNEIKALFFYSRFNEHTYGHGFLGPIEYLNDIVASVGWPATIYLAESQMPDCGWEPRVRMLPGQVLDHPDCAMLFERICPSFIGTVYAHE